MSSRDNTVAISYAWVDSTYQQKIIGFANYLRENGYDAVMDVILKQQVTAVDFNEMMVKMIPNANKVIIFLSDKYKCRADLFQGGVGTEYRIIFDEIGRIANKYIFVTFEQLAKIQPEEILPNGLGNREIIEISENNSDWEEMLFSKLSDLPIYAFSNVAPIKKIPTSKVLSFKVAEKRLGKYNVYQKTKILLAENKQLLIQYGPSSFLSINNPMSDSVEIWKQIKIGTIIPNNKKIVEMFEVCLEELTDSEIECYEKFKLHARAFEINQGNRLDRNAVPCFPKDFEQMIYEEE